MNDWVYFYMHSPTHDDLPIVATGNGTGLGIWENTLPARWDNRWTAWRSIGPLPKAVDEGAWIGYCQSLLTTESYTPRDHFLAGYAAGLKKGNG